MSKDTECPYCGADVEINHDDGYGYSEDDLHQQGCRTCGKEFTYTTAIHFSYRASKADCLNDGEHQYEKTKTYPPEFARLRCKECGDEKPLKANELGQGSAACGASPAPTGCASNGTNDERTDK